MRRSLPWVIIATGVVVLAALGWFVIGGGGSPSRPVTTGAAPSKAVPGFDQIGFSVRAPGLATPAAGAKHCALLAVTKAQQNQGLMNRQDLGGYDGMIFRFPSPTTTQFYMKDTLIPLSIAFFDTSGRFVSQTDMAPCPPATVCPLYHARGPYTDAIEVPQGQLTGMGIGPGSSLTVGGSC